MNTLLTPYDFRCWELNVIYLNANNLSQNMNNNKKELLTKEKAKTRISPVVALKIIIVLVTLVFLVIFGWFIFSRRAEPRIPKNLRAWYTAGQTFLVWKNPSEGPPPDTYEIYTSSAPIDSLANATWIGKVYSDNGANKRLQMYVNDARWKLPDGQGGFYPVAQNEVYFVSTPHEAGNSYYAVVPGQGTEVESQNTVGPITERIDPIQAYLQYQDEEDNLSIYAHWIDGRADYESGRDDYEVMGNENSNGLGFNFAIWEPSTLLTENMPFATWLHGIGGSFVSPDMIQDGPTMMPNGLFATFDDTVESSSPLFTSWIGYVQTFDRFNPEVEPTNNNVMVVDYTARRVWWETDWITKNITVNLMSVDPERVSLVGESMGGNAVLLHSQLRPDIYAATMANVPRLNIQPGEIWFPLWGSPALRLRTTFSGNPALWNVINAQWRANQPHDDWPYALMISGTNDTGAGWQASSEAFVLFNNTKTGYATYWDGRTHTEWEGQYFYSSEHLAPSYLERFKKNKSFPAFSETDINMSLPERQAEIDNLVDYPYGNWGGYLEWDPDEIVDEATRWKTTVWITNESSCECDILPDPATIQADVTLRRLQIFNPDPAKTYNYELTEISSGIVKQSGTVSPDGQGILTVPALRFSKNPYRLTIEET